jgi:nicotinate-nucleotide--dimethylbenzimidazole phosphoribosyltransferase
MRRILRDLPGPDLEAGTAAATRIRARSAPGQSLGRLDDSMTWLATWQGRHPPRLDHPRTVIFAANHGLADSAARAATAELVRRFIDGEAAVHQLVAAIDGDFRVHEMALDRPTRDIADAPAMDEEDCAKAIAYGMMAVEPDLDILALGSVAAGGTAAAAAICLALFGGPASDWADGAEIGLIDAAVERHRPALADPFETLRHLGGPELAAVVGAVMAARLARTPVLLDGYAVTAAAAILFAADPRALDHCCAAQRTTEHGHAALLRRIGKPALLDLGIGTGDATGATLAVPLLRMALACHLGMAAALDDA